MGCNTNPETLDEAVPGPPCVDDQGCEGYLRCIEATCETPPAITGVATRDTPTVSFSNAGKTYSEFNIELADEPWEMTRGLMFRRSMDPKWGMLFVYPIDGQRSFWMKNTLLSLDMVFVNSEGIVVNIIEGVPPLTLESRSSTGPARYVLELNAGAAKAAGIAAGHVMDVSGVPPHQQPRR